MKSMKCDVYSCYFEVLNRLWALYTVRVTVQKRTRSSVRGTNTKSQEGQKMVPSLLAQPILVRLVSLHG